MTSSSTPVPSTAPPTPPRFERILWLTDLSERAAACQPAVRWLATPGDGGPSAHVLAAHALGADVGLDAARQEQRRRQALAQVAALAGDLGSIGLETSSRVEPGQPWDLVRRLVQESAVDLCVLGRTGLSGLDRLLLGSTAQRLVRELSIPMMVVQDGEAIPPRQIVCAVDPAPDGSPGVQPSLHAIALATALARRSGARLSFVSVAVVSSFVPEDRLEIGRRLEERVASAGPAEGLQISQRVVLARSPAEGLAEAAQRADLLVIGTSGRSGLARLILGSVAEELLKHCPVNTLVVH